MLEAYPHPRRPGHHAEPSYNQHALPVIIGAFRVQEAEPCIVTGELRIWEDVGENGMDELDRKFEDCRDQRMGWGRLIPDWESQHRRSY